MKFPILFEDDDFMVIDKPSGVVVNRAESVKGETVQDWAEKKLGKLDKFDQLDQDFIGRAGIVHRIDKETSGILLIAKNPQAFRELQRQFKERIVKKTYLAWVHGKLVPEEGEIRVPIGRLPWNRERFGIVPGGKEAVTRYKVVSRQLSVNSKTEDRELRTESFSLVELYPETGRTHQIRVHLKYINHPIVGDFLYAGRMRSREDRMISPRVMLHAWKISFFHPRTGTLLAFVAPIPDDMNSIINKSDK